MRKFRINVDGSTYDVEVEELGADSIPAASAPAAAPVAAAAPAPAAPKPAAPKPAAAKVDVGDGTPVNAPMPGNILSIAVKQGQSVKSGETLMVLEAMKMENEILSPKDGVVKTVAVAAGDAVQTGTLLAVIG